MDRKESLGVLSDDWNAMEWNVSWMGNIGMRWDGVMKWYVLLFVYDDGWIPLGLQCLAFCSCRIGVYFGSVH